MGVLRDKFEAEKARRESEAYTQNNKKSNMLKNVMLLKKSALYLDNSNTDLVL